MDKDEIREFKTQRIGRNLNAELTENAEDRAESKRRARRGIHAEVEKMGLEKKTFVLIH